MPDLVLVDAPRAPAIMGRMPAPPKTSDAAIIAAARAIVERSGAESLSMAEVAKVVGVRAASLYGRFADRAKILEAVELDLWRSLRETLAAARQAVEPMASIRAQARAYRRFAKAHRHGYALMFDRGIDDADPGTDARWAAVAPVLPPLTELVGEASAFAAARVFTPFIHGFVSMELAGAFRLGGGLDEAFENGLNVILAGLTKTTTKTKTR
jgi:AcrR family transcriptional regulator